MGLRCFNKNDILQQLNDMTMPVNSKEQSLNKDESICCIPKLITWQENVLSAYVSLTWAEKSDYTVSQNLLELYNFIIRLRFNGNQA